MGTILTSKMADDEKVVVELILDYNEYIQLKGHLHNVHIFSEDNIQTTATMTQRGRNSATKYFLIPREMRKDIKFSGEVSCHKIDLKNKKVFVYVVKKGGF